MGDILGWDVPEGEKVDKSIGCGVSFIGKLGAEIDFCPQIGFLVAGSRDGISECRLQLGRVFRKSSLILMVFGGWNAKL